ncbi:hypothetical protein [Kitasatospora sp. NPDC085464]|uniref:hypothetical protein n=1 Tax=Kitasatospora sp. NPDC085464 TaxID=3364063 RepID=UPI0037C7F1A3
MSSTTRVRRSRRAVTVAAALGVLALGGSLALPAQAAFADGVHQGTLTVQTPQEVGFAGQPVAFTETVTNTGTETTAFSLVLQTTTEAGTPEHAITIDYKDPANGKWTSVPLEFYRGDDEATYHGLINGITVAAGKTVKLDMRIGAPMGLPHDGASNGGFRSITLSSRLTVPGTWENLGELVRTISVEPIVGSLAHVPATAVAGGAPIEFDAVLSNPTPSAYINLGNVLFTDSHATVQVRKADGTWTTLKKYATDTDDTAGVYLQGRNSSIGAGKTTVSRVRVSYDGTTPLGATRINPCVFVNEGSAPFWGTTNCSQGSTVNVVAPAATPAPTTPPTSTPTTAPGKTPGKTGGTSGTGTEQGTDTKQGTDVKQATDTKPATDTAPAPVAPVVAAAPAAGAAPAAPAVGELAATGAESSTIPAVAAAALATLGAGALVLVGRLRRRS